MATGLELFYNDYGGYPASTGTPAYPNGIAPSYIGATPSSPVPADGTCTAGSTGTNAYTYATSGTAFVSPKDNTTTVYPSYSYTFCLGAATGGFASGVHTASPQGIQ